ncbi:MAG: hypothetical protein D3924_05315 [Candidatus Electrothrix sp. AR4]|nr:hypothetical protein [Candidatus Electrothrix sp. AR4]
MKKIASIFILSVLSLLVLSVPYTSLNAAVAKDDILTTIDEAVKQYKAGDFAAAVSNLDYATQLIRQKKANE